MPVMVTVNTGLLGSRSRTARSGGLQGHGLTVTVTVGYVMSCRRWHEPGACGWDLSRPQGFPIPVYNLASG